MKKIYSVIALIIIVTSCVKERDPLNTPQLSNAATTVDSTDLVFISEIDSVIADGKATIALTLSVSKKILDKAQNATFNVSPIGNFSTGEKNISIDLDIEGKGIVFVSSASSGLSYIKASVGELTRTAIVRFYPPTPIYPKDTLILTLQGNGARADNYNTIEILARIKDPELFSKSKKITFTTVKGLFANDNKSYTVNAGVDSIARAYIKHNVSEQVIVSVTLDNTYTENITVQFSVSKPEHLQVEPASSILSPLYTSNMVIAARLLRNLGVVSQGQSVVFKDSTRFGINTVGTFLNTTTSDANGLATAKYWIQDTSFRGDIFIICEAQGDNGTIRNVNKIFVTN